MKKLIALLASSLMFVGAFTAAPVLAAEDDGGQQQRDGDAQMRAAAMGALRSVPESFMHTAMSSMGSVRARETTATITRDASPDNAIYSLRIIQGLAIDGVLVTSADVTHSDGRSPTPLLIEVSPAAIFASAAGNSVSSDFTCFVLASGVGDFANRRVMTRVESFSCHDKVAGMTRISGVFDGYVVDDDDKVGLRGAADKKERKDVIQLPVHHRVRVIPIRAPKVL